MKSRHDLAKHFAEKGYTVGAEIGVLGGSYSTLLCEYNPNLKLYCIDIWNRPRKWEEAQLRLKDFNVELIRKRSLEAVKDFKNGSLDFVYIDAAHDFDNVMQDIIQWAPKVREGGIVSGHDYGNDQESTPNNGVKDAVDMYVKWHNKEFHVLPQASQRWVNRVGRECRAYTWWFAQ